MTWEFLAIRRPGDIDGRLWPMVAGDAKTVVLDQGEAPVSVRSGALYVREGVGAGQRPKTLVTVNHRTTLVVSDHRVVVTCEAYNRPVVVAGGGGILALLTLVLAGVRWAAARNARRGTLLVGQVRYPWLTMVGHRKRVLRLGVRTVDAGRPRVLLLDVVNGHADAAVLAKDIAVRAARAQLAATPPGPARSQLELLTGPTLAPPPEDKKAFAVYAFPSPWPVSPDTVDPGALPWPPT